MCSWQNDLHPWVQGPLNRHQVLPDEIPIRVNSYVVFILAASPTQGMHQLVERHSIKVAFSIGRRVDGFQVKPFPGFGACRPVPIIGRDVDIRMLVFILSAVVVGWIDPGIRAYVPLFFLC